jgi:hypothetical protein
MAKKITNNTIPIGKQREAFEPGIRPPNTLNEAQKMMAYNNALLSRAVLAKLQNPNAHNIDYECGYPSVINIADYKAMYDRDGISARVVNIWPEECWVVEPDIYEDEDVNAETDFEKAWNALAKEKSLMEIMNRADEMSGIGRFGLIILGLGDGLTLEQPVANSNRRGVFNQLEETKLKKLLYVKVADESAVTIAKRETDTKNPRYGMPVMYNVIFDNGEDASESKTVHWTRCIHIADNRKSSDIFGVPRMKNVYNRLLDIKKILSSSGEMFYKGGFPGYSFETQPDLIDQTVDEASLKAQVEQYMNGLRRYMSTKGMTVKSLTPQVADPSQHLDSQMKNLAVSLKVPWRIFLGTEEAKIAGSQDSKAWNKRLARRQNTYLTPKIIRPLVDRLIAVGVLPQPVEYFVDWADLDALSDNEKADIAVKRTQALAAYISGGCDALVPPQEYFTKFLDMSMEEAEAIIAAAEDYEPIVDPNEEAEAEIAAAKKLPAAGGKNKNPVGNKKRRK